MKTIRRWLLVLASLMALLMASFFYKSFSDIRHIWRTTAVHNYADTIRRFSKLDESQIQQTQQTQQLKAKHHVAFLKVHKAASTTIQNIFLRFAMHRNLFVVLPPIPKRGYPNIISNAETITSKNILPPPKNRSYEILCCHVVYNRTAFEKVMPSDTVYIGSIRDPFEQFISILNYFRPKKVLEIDDPFPVSRFLRNPSKYENKSTNSFIYNRMAFEYNFPANLFETKNQSGILNYLHKLEEEFQLIMVIEQFDESVVLMRRLLNWKVKDILYMKQNVKYKMYYKVKFKPGDVEYYQRWAVLDYALYNHFYQRLHAQIREQGPDFQDELLYFKRLRRDMEFFCQESRHLKDGDAYSVSASKWSEAFNVSKTDCHYMQLGEMRYIQEIREHQYGKIKENSFASLFMKW